jgi:hypothetical protein
VKCRLQRRALELNERVGPVGVINSGGTDGKRGKDYMETKRGEGGVTGQQ